MGSPFKMIFLNMYVLQANSLHFEPMPHAVAPTGPANWPGGDPTLHHSLTSRGPSDHLADQPLRNAAVKEGLGVFVD